MRLAAVVLSYLLFGGLVHAQGEACSVCPKPEFGSPANGGNVCLSSKQLAAQILTRKPIGPPGMNELHMNSHGTVVICLCFDRSGKVTDVRILSGPAMMQQPVLESVKDWTFSPAKRGGRLYGGCGSLRIRVDMDDSQVKSAIEE